METHNYSHCRTALKIYSQVNVIIQFVDSQIGVLQNEVCSEVKVDLEKVNWSDQGSGASDLHEEYEKMGLKLEA